MFKNAFAQSQQQVPFQSQEVVPKRLDHQDRNHHKSQTTRYESCDNARLWPSAGIETKQCQRRSRPTLAISELVRCSTVLLSQAKTSISQSYADQFRSILKLSRWVNPTGLLFENRSNGPFEHSDISILRKKLITEGNQQPVNCHRNIGIGDFISIWVPELPTSPTNHSRLSTPPLCLRFNSSICLFPQPQG